MDLAELRKIKNFSYIGPLSRLLHDGIASALARWDSLRGSLGMLAIAFRSCVSKKSLSQDSLGMLAIGKKMCAARFASTGASTGTGEIHLSKRGKPSARLTKPVPPSLSKKRPFQGSLGMLTIAFPPCQ
jgi:hypothetical protein